MSQLSFEEGFTEEKFANDTSRGPDIDRGGVLPRPKHALRCPVVAGCDVGDRLLVLLIDLLG